MKRTSTISTLVNTAVKTIVKHLSEFIKLQAFNNETVKKWLAEPQKC